MDVSQNSHQVIWNVDVESLPQMKILNLSGTLVKLEMLPAKHLQNLRKITLTRSLGVVT